MHCTNFRELETRLKQQNPNLYDAFTTDSDCEVLLHLYKETGAYVCIILKSFSPLKFWLEKKNVEVKFSFEIDSVLR